MICLYRAWRSNHRPTGCDTSGWWREKTAPKTGPWRPRRHGLVDWFCEFEHLASQTVGDPKWYLIHIKIPAAKKKRKKNSNRKIWKNEPTLRISTKKHGESYDFPDPLVFGKYILSKAGPATFSSNFCADRLEFRFNNWTWGFDTGSKWPFRWSGWIERLKRVLWNFGNERIEVKRLKWSCVSERLKTDFLMFFLEWWFGPCVGANRKNLKLQTRNRRTDGLRCCGRVWEMNATSQC